ncbi:DUF3089 domain-containing protein [Croceicoccus mobilis]|uniref:DUF3089 domain-containing protein n=1 Tax=Croceicoccus mobilis TaxID=1703339 RepID=A0A917DTC5_9SPHN|nr:DUF3089 domain-containing protein [Croceicoccus mobilis]GGD68447.1 hypothetical protein GCM10010990_17450 [Croceicoccus mobilis]
MARKFLYLIAFLVVLVIGGGIAMTIWAEDLTRLAFVPSAEFEEQAALEDNAYEDPAMWIARPGMGDGDPARWRPAGFAEEDIAAPSAVFFVHPTSYVERGRWNAPIDDAKANGGAKLFVQGMASPFNRSIQIWAPRYRQATVGAFLTDKPEAKRAVDAAYADVAQAFDFFVATIPADAPIVLAGHSQGSLHLIRLMKEKIAGTPIADRIVAAYPVGWPVSTKNDLPAMGLPACATADQPGCVMSWQSFAEPADPESLLAAYAKGPDLDGVVKLPENVLCSNPLTGGIGGEAPASANDGTLVPNGDMSGGELVADAVPAKCDPRGILLIGDPPEMGNAVLPGNNYHVYDIPLFWMNLREDYARREAAWLAAHDRAAPAAKVEPETTAS